MAATIDILSWCFNDILFCLQFSPVGDVSLRSSRHLVSASTIIALGVLICATLEKDKLDKFDHLFHLDLWRMRTTTNLL